MKELGFRRPVPACGMKISQYRKDLVRENTPQSTINRAPFGLGAVPKIEVSQRQSLISKRSAGDWVPKEIESRTVRSRLNYRLVNRMQPRELFPGL